jgi:hypothetical protein
MEKRLKVKVSLVVTDDQGSVTVQNDLILGLMKLEDAIKTEQALIGAFAGLLEGQAKS